MSKFLAFALICSFVVGLVILGCGGAGQSQYALSVARLAKLNHGMITYVGDYDGAYPPGAAWMDSIAPYVSDPDAFHSPALDGAGYGYALNANIAGEYYTHLPDPSTVLSIFDSTDFNRNAVQAPTSIPSPPRYGARNTLAYADGHVQDEIVIVVPPTPYERSQGRLRRVTVAMLTYASDYDDRAPLANQWTDQLTPYVTDVSVFKSPKVEANNPNNYGYAMNSDFAGAYLSGLLNPTNTITFFDSLLLGRNATGSISTMPNPPRYGTHNTTAYADGSVR